jgi:hypothetical protein
MNHRNGLEVGWRRQEARRWMVVVEWSMMI